MKRRAKSDSALRKAKPILTSAEDSSYFEPFSSLSNEYLVHFIRLMEAYQATEETE